MPMPEVAVEIAALAPVEPSSPPVPGAGGPPPRLSAVLLDACTDASGTGVCVAAEDTAAAAVDARIEWFTDRIVRVEVSSNGGSGKPHLRLLRFGPRDQAEEVWRAVGFSVGTMAGVFLQRRTEAAAEGATTAPAEGTAIDGASGARASGEPRVDEPPVGEGAERVPPEATLDEDAASRRARAPGSEAVSEPPWWVALGAVVGPGLRAGPWKAGAMLRVARRWDGVFVAAGAEYAASVRDVEGVRARWISPAVGAGYVFGSTGPVQFELRADLAAEQLRVRVDAPEEGMDEAARWIPAARLGGYLVWPALARVSLAVGAQGVFRTAPTDVLVRGDSVATAPLADFQLGAALRLGLP